MRTKAMRRTARRGLPSGRTFMKKAAKGGMMEVAMGNLAAENGQSDDVKSFGKRMVTDHSKANDELKSIASQKGVTLPAKEPTLKWNSDKAYINMMVKDHEQDIAEFRHESTSGQKPDIKHFAALLEVCRSYGERRLASQIESAVIASTPALAYRKECGSIGHVVMLPGP